MICKPLGSWIRLFLALQKWNAFAVVEIEARIIHPGECSVGSRKLKLNRKIKIESRQNERSMPQPIVLKLIF
jgi:hypothetical protein